MTGAKRRALTLGNARHLLQCIDWPYSNQSDASSKVRGLDMALFPAQSLIREVGLRDGLQSIQSILSTDRNRPSPPSGTACATHNRWRSA
jgi:hypothetical protein